MLTPHAPRDNAAAKPRASAIPPDAIINLNYQRTESTALARLVQEGQDRQYRLRQGDRRIQTFVNNTYAIDRDYIDTHLLGADSVANRGAFVDHRNPGFFESSLISCQYPHALLGHSRQSLQS